VAALAELIRGATHLTEAPELLWIASAGDLMLGRGAEQILFREGPEGIFSGAAAILRDADLSLVNLEGAVSARGTRTAKALFVWFV
jgi:poly-gamma-glutamate synthesis protein (capsule biosynthesis protein)